MRVLLDTNVMSDLIRNPQGRIAERIKVVGEANVCTSIVVAAELRSGATKKASSKLTAQVEAVLGAIDTSAFDAPGDEIYRSILVQLESAGTPIGGNDLRGTAYRELATAASTTQTRTTRSEVKFVSAVSVAAVQRKAGDLAQELRQLDTRIQEADWKTDLI